MKTHKIILVAAVLSLIAFFASAMKDPSQVYCESLGHRFVSEESDDGYTGYCVIGDVKVDSWKFIKGEVSPEAGACAKKGQTLKTINDSVKCWYTGTGMCAACVDSAGTEVEVTKLMDLNFLESTCGDKICGMPENHKSCPGDCESGSADNLCDGVSDGMCDPDCGVDTDADCGGLPATKPIDKKDGGCLPMLLAPLALAASIAVKAFRL